MTDSEKLDLIISTLNEHTAMLKRHEEEISSVKFLLENEIRVNIQRVAEGHLDLSRNLHEAMRPSSEVEMLAIKVRQLESDMREIKQKIS